MPVPAALKQEKPRSRSPASVSRATHLKLSSISSAASRGSSNIDPDRLDKACGFAPSAVAWGTSTATAVNTSTKDAPRDGQGPDLDGLREEHTVDSISANKKASKYPPYEYPDIRDVLKSLSLVLRAQGQKMRDYIEVEDMVEAREQERKAALLKRSRRASTGGPEDSTKRGSELFTLCVCPSLTVLFFSCSSGLR